ncbi:MAG: hypothetical protein ACM30E_02910 [Nitrososphaerales archaeon]
MGKYRTLLALIAFGLVVLAAGLFAGFFLPSWDYSTTYAPIIGAPAPSSGLGAPAELVALSAGMRA